MVAAGRSSHRRRPHRGVGWPNEIGSERRFGGLIDQDFSAPIALVVFRRLRYKLSLRDLAEMFLLRDIIFSYEAVRALEAKLTPSMITALRKRRGGGARIGRSWYVDETYVKVRGRWCYLYRAIDRAGRLVDARLSQTRDMAAAIAFFEAATTVTGAEPSRVTTDGHGSYPRAIRTVIGAKGQVRHRTNRYLNNCIEQDHRGIKSRYEPMKGLELLLPPPASAQPSMNFAIFSVLIKVGVLQPRQRRHARHSKSVAILP